MKKIITQLLAAMFIFPVLIMAFNFKSFAYSEVPDYFDFGDCTVSVDAGATRDVWLRSSYKYTCYVGPHTSSKTYIECSEKAGTENVRIHIGPDETEKNVFFYFYVKDDKVGDSDIHDCIEVYVQNIDYSYVERQAQAAPLKAYANNSSDFNAYDYYMNYEDIRNACGVDGDALFNHYNALGRNEGRVANRLLG